MSRADAAWLVAMLLTLHNAEEALAFKTYLPRLPTLLPEPIATLESRLSYPTLLIALGLLSLAGILVAIALSLRPASALALWLLISLEAGIALNVIAHVVTAVFVFGGYSPGLITALAINAPFAIYFFRRVSRERWVKPLWAALPIAFVLHGPVLIGGLWLLTR